MSAKTFSITIKEDLSTAEALLRAIILNDYEIRYLCFKKEDYLIGMLQFNKRKTIIQVSARLKTLKIFTDKIEKVYDINGFYKELHKDENNIQIEKGTFIGSGGSKIDPDGISYESIVQYFEEGGDPNEIIRNLGAKVLKFNFRHIYREVNLMKIHDAKQDTIHKAITWWEKTAYPWQKEARHILERWSKQENDRKILIVYDPKGNHGKTVFCKTD